MAAGLPHFAAQIANWLGLHERRCTACGEPFMPNASPAAQGSSYLCPACAVSLAPCWLPRCRRCGIPWAALGPGGSLCPACRKTRRPWDQIAFHGLYEGELRELILRLKFGAEFHISHLLAEFLLNASACLPAPQAILSIPQHRSQLFKRGYNQAHELAKRLAHLSGLPLRPNLLFRVKSGKAQESLGAAQRRANLAAAFRAGAGARGKTLWLIDDVLTTGSTCMAAASALKAGGARAVHLLFVARTPLR